MCPVLKCDDEQDIEARLRQRDPDNGFAWSGNLERANASGSNAWVTEAVQHMASASAMDLYRNRLWVMVIDALATADPSLTPFQRGLRGLGLLSPPILPPFLPMSKACSRDHLDLPGRRQACAMLVAHMERADTVIAQRFALHVQRRWCKSGSPECEVLRVKFRQLDYLMEQSGRVRWRFNRVMGICIDAARSSERGEDVMRAVTAAFGSPLTPPEGWKDSQEPGYR